MLIPERDVYKRQIQKFAKAEGLTAHANSIRVRFEEDDDIKE